MEKYAIVLDTKVQYYKAILYLFSPKSIRIFFNPSQNLSTFLWKLTR